MKNRLSLIVLIATVFLIAPAFSADYKIDTDGAHASINFKIPHLGYSILVGRFDKFSGDFSYDDKNPQASKVDVTIDTTSLNSNHPERDGHLQAEGFLNTKEFPTATFVSEKFVSDDGKMGSLQGKLTLRGVTKDVEIQFMKIGEGKDPWGGYRVGFAGSTTLTLKDFGIPTDLGASAQEVELELYIEGIRK
ncbi:YceI family protein [Aurantivibrio infirmus]